MRATRFERAVDSVVSTGRCSGCGLCAQLDDRVSMGLQDGFMRPAFSGEGIPGGDREDRQKVRRLRAACPGLRVTAAGGTRGLRHPILGPVLGVWEAHATDPVLRHRGSSGGVLSALNLWLLEQGEVSKVVGASADAGNPRRTVPVTIRTREEVEAAAGSRYAPVSVLSQERLDQRNIGITCKPCEASALRADAEFTGGAEPFIMSFFCAGTPSQQATEDLIQQLGVGPERPLSSLRYRGDGWPGRFTAVSEDGQEVSTSYHESWGKSLGPTVQWRCRVCVDGVGESADISACDFWKSGDEGYPDFEDRPGRSALIARTERGLDVVRRAVAAGVIVVDDALPEDVVAMNPYQRDRRKYILGRLAATLLFYRRVPFYSGFQLWKFLLRSPRRILHEFRGTVTRLRARRRQGALR